MTKDFAIDEADRATDSDLGRCLRTAADVNPGQVGKYPASMAAHHVETVGLNAAACRKAIKSDLVS